jgi:hypothetical protein
MTPFIYPQPVASSSLEDTNFWANPRQIRGGAGRFHPGRRRRKFGVLGWWPLKQQG